jgi:hypothetical protein
MKTVNRFRVKNRTPKKKYQSKTRKGMKIRKRVLRDKGTSNRASSVKETEILITLLLYNQKTRPVAQKIFQTNIE